METITFIAIGIFTGFVSGLFGIGGGSIRVPLLIMTGMPLVNSFATNMFAIPFSSGTGSYVQRKNIEWKVVRSFVMGGTLGILIATFLVGVIASKFLAVIFFFAALLTIFGLYLNKISFKIYNCITPSKINLFLGPFFLNLIIGLRGGSGGTLYPALLHTMHVEMHKAIATSLFTGFFTSFAALSIYLFRGDVMLLPAIIVGITNVIGAYLGSKLSLVTDSKWLKLGLSFIVALLAFYVLYKEFFLSL